MAHGNLDHSNLADSTLDKWLKEGDSVVFTVKGYRAILIPTYFLISS